MVSGLSYVQNHGTQADLRERVVYDSPQMLVVMIPVQGEMVHRRVLPLLQRPGAVAVS